MSDIVMIEREDLLEKELFLEWQQTSERQYALTWQVCRGEWYEVQQWLQEEQRWQTKEIFHRTENLCYQTGHLPSSRQIRFRVISYIDPDKRDQEEFESEPSEVTFHTDMSPLYCTIWPIIPLNYFSCNTRNIISMYRRHTMNTAGNVIITQITY